MHEHLTKDEQEACKQHKKACPTDGFCAFCMLVVHLAEAREEITRLHEEIKEHHKNWSALGQAFDKWAKIARRWTPTKRLEGE